MNMFGMARARSRALYKLYWLCRFLPRLLTCRNRLLPTFLIIGVQKGGTASLLKYLCRHPVVLPPFAKEPHFFDYRHYLGAAGYRAFFPSKKEAVGLRAVQSSKVQCGEATPYYVYDPKVPFRVKQLLPHAKLMLLLRNPVERAFSHYRHNKSWGLERRSFADAVQSELQDGPAACLQLRQSGRDPYQQHRHFTYLTRGLYLEQIKAWHGVFPREQMLILKSEDFFGNTAHEFNRVLRFLNLDPYRPEEGFQPYNVGVQEHLAPALRRRLAAFYKEPNKRLCEYLGVDFGWQ